MWPPEAGRRAGAESHTMAACNADIDSVYIELRCVTVSIAWHSMSTKEETRTVWPELVAALEPLAIAAAEQGLMGFLVHQRVK